MISLALADNKEIKNTLTRAAIVHLNFRAGSTFPVPVCTVPHLHWVNKSTRLAGATRLTRSDLMLHIGADLLLLKGQR